MFATHSCSTRCRSLSLANERKTKRSRDTLALVLFAVALFVGSAVLHAQDAEPAEPAPFPLTGESVAERFSQADLMRRVGREDLAREQLRLLFEQQPTDEQYLEIRNRYGTGVLLRFGREEALQPEGRQLLDAVIAAVDRTAADADQTEALTTALAADGERRVNAEVEARRRGRPLAINLINRIDGAGEQQLTGIIRGLRAIGRAAGEPLAVAALENLPGVAELLPMTLPVTAGPDALLPLLALESDPSRPPATRAAAAAALNELAAPQQRVDPARTLRQAALAELREQSPAKRTVLIVDPTTGRLVEQALSGDLASRVLATRSVQAALATGDTTDEVRTLAGLLEVGGDAVTQSPLVQLATALDLRLDDAAIDALRRLDAATPVPLDAASPVVAALNAPSREVQFAAAVALADEPTGTFPNAHRVVEIILANLTTDGRPVAVICDPNVARGGATAGRFQSYGYRTVAVATGREAIAAAANDATCELVVLDPNTIRNPLSTTLAELAADRRTAEIPAAILTFAGTYANVSRAARNHPKAIVLANAVDDRYVLDQLSGAMPPAGERLDRSRRARLALDALGRVAASGSRQVERLSLALPELITISFDPRANLETRRQAAAVLAAIGDRDARASLLRLATATSGDPSILTSLGEQRRNFPSIAD